MENLLERRPGRAKASMRHRQLLEDLSIVCQQQAGRRALAHILANLGLGRQIAPEESLCLGHALGVLENIKKVSPEAAARILRLTHGLEENDGNEC